jgi:hypothetical protein
VKLFTCQVFPPSLVDASASDPPMMQVDTVGQAKDLLEPRSY